MKLLFTASIILFTISVSAQKQYNVLDWKTDATLNTYLVQKMHEQYDLRRKEFAKAIISKKATQVYQESIRKKFQQILGNLPSKTSLNARITGNIKDKGYQIEKVIYESFPNHHVTANLYIPQGRGPFPAALLFCGHEDVSKATESYQKTAILFAKNGFVVFVIDPISQSERYQLTDANGKRLTRGGTTEHTLLNESSNLVGLSTPADELWDNERGLDYLVTRKEVDTSRIGCLGNSGGGMQTIYFAAFDKRIKVIAPCSYLATRERTLELTGPADGCAQMPNEGKAGLELSDYLIAAAPRPILILAGRYDFIDYTGAVIAYDELKKVYTSLGQPQKVRLFTYDDGHGISKPKREAAITWFRKWLCNDSTTVKEMNMPILSDKELLCTSTGQVNKEFSEEVTIAKRNLMLFDSFEVSRRKFLQQGHNIILKKIRKVLSITDDHAKMEIEETGKVKNNSVPFHKLILRKEDEIPLPLLVAYPSDSIRNVIVWLDDEGKRKIADSSELIRSYLHSGCAVVLADIRGMGETEDKPELNDTKYYNKEYRNAMLALHIGKPIVGQRVIDIETILDFIKNNNRLRNLPVEVNASGLAALPALHATVLNKEITHLNLYHSIRSYQDILNNPIERNWYSYVIPDVLKYYDLSDLVNLAGTKRVQFIGN